jgi:hypothetical protein
MDINKGITAAKTPLIIIAVLSILTIILSIIPSPFCNVPLLLSALAFIAIGQFGAKGGASMAESVSVSAISALLILVTYILVNMALSHMISSLELFFGIIWIFCCAVGTAFGYLMGSMFKQVKK